MKKRGAPLVGSFVEIGISGGVILAGPRAVVLVTRPPLAMLGILASFQHTARPGCRASEDCKELQRQMNFCSRICDGSGGMRHKLVMAEVCRRLGKVIVAASRCMVMLFRCSGRVVTLARIVGMMMMDLTAGAGGERSAGLDAAVTLLQRLDCRLVGSRWW